MNMEPLKTIEKEFIDLVSKGQKQKIHSFLKANSEILAGANSQGISFVLLGLYLNDRDTAIQIAQSKSSIDIFEMVGIGDLESLKKELEKDPSLLETISNDGFSLLGLAAFFGFPGIVKHLIKSGARINQASANKMQVTPLHSACARGNSEIAGILLDAGADPNVPQQMNIFPIHSAAHLGNIKLLKLLLAYGADITVKSQDGRTAQDFAEDSARKEQVISILANFKKI